MLGEVLTGQPALVAGEVKHALLEALAPVWRATLAGLQQQPALADPERVLLVVTLRPAIVRVIREASEGQPALELIRLNVKVLPSDGSELVDAVTAYLAGTLEAMDLDAADRALRYALAVGQAGGFLLVVRPATEETRLFLARAGEDLSTALDLGGVAEAVTVH